MSELETALDSCLDRIARGELTVEQCLERVPDLAVRLRPMVQAAIIVGQSQPERMPDAARLRLRTRLIEHMGLDPMENVRIRSRSLGRRARRSIPPAARRQRRPHLAAGLAAVALAVISVGTAAAQVALPGGPLYGWKHLSEVAWVATRPDRLQGELALLERRADELVRLSGVPAREQLALDGLQDQLFRLAAYENPSDRARVRLAVELQFDRLRQQGAPLPEQDSIFPDLPQPGPEATATPGSVLLPSQETPALPLLPPDLLATGSP